MTRPPGPSYTPHPITASHELSSVQPVHSLDWDNSYIANFPILAQLSSYIHITFILLHGKSIRRYSCPHHTGDYDVGSGGG